MFGDDSRRGEEMTQPNHPFKPPDPSDGKIINSCAYQGCGLSKEAHGPQPVKIKFQGKLWIFKNWEEAHAKGFYVGD